MSEETRNLIKVQGSGGGKSGGGDTYEADDNLFARQSVAYIDALAEGPIKGLVYGDASIFVNEVRLRDVNLVSGSIVGKPNFKNFQVSTKTGQAEQSLDGAWFSTYPSASIIQEIGSAPLKTNEPQYFTISSSQFNKAEADYIKITIYTPSMQRIVKSGDDKGDILPTEVNFNIILRYVNNAGVTKETVLARTGFSGKVTSKYSHTFGFNIETIKDSEGITDWALKVVRASSPTSNSTQAIYNDIYVESIEANISDRLEYPYTAYVAGAIDAEQFSGPPNRGYEIDGKIIDVPSNYIPVDYEGKKVVVDSIPASFAVGQTLENTVNAASVIITGDDEEDIFTVEVFTTNTPGLLVGSQLEVTISGITGTGNSYVNGTFLAEVVASNKLQYTFVIDADDTFDKTNLTTTSTKIEFSTATIDLIDSANNTLYLRDVDARRKIGFNTTISNGTDTATVQSAEQAFIPANYRRSPTTGLLTTTEQDWDGTFYQSWANNPAWVLWDLMTNKLYGLGNYIENYQINKWELFQIGRYCDELVPAGIQAADLLSIYTTDDANYIPAGETGLFEPRFSCNLVLQTQAEAFKVLNDITSMFRGMLFWINGEAFVSQDVDKDPVYQFTNGNVVGGAFAYEGSSNKTRLNQVLVTWNNPQDLYRQRIEYVEDEEELQKDDSFLKKDEMVAMGCTSRGQARRLGKWRLLTEKLQNDTVNFKTSFNASFLRPGDIISIVDKNRSGKSWGGRINSGTTSTVKLDREFTIESGYVAGDYSVRCSFVGYKGLLNQDSATIGSVAYVRGQEIPNINSDEDAAKVQDDDGNTVYIQWTPYTFTEEQTLSSVSTTDGKSTLNVASNFSEAPSNDQIWLVSRNTASTGKIKQQAKLYKVLAMSEDSIGNYDVSALIHIPDKFDAVDKNEGIEQYVAPTVPTTDATVPLPRNLQVVPNYIAGGVGVTGNNSIPVLQITWEPPRNTNGSVYEYVGAYAVQYSTDAKNWLTAGATTTTNFTIEDAPPQYYYIRVRVNSVQNNKKSDWVEWQGQITFQDNNPGVGDTQFTISKTGFADTAYQIGSSNGNVVFAPTTFDFFNGSEVNIIENQPKVDFSTLADGSTAYLFYDYSASVLKAVEYSSSSDSFRVLGDNYFTAGAGTITSSVRENVREVVGNGTSFCSDLLVNNVIEYTVSGSSYYARVARIESQSSLYTEVPISDKLSACAYSIPTLLVDYLKDRIIAEVKNDGGTFTLRKLTNGVGDSAYEVIGTNEAHVFSASSDGVLLAGELSGYSNSYTVKKGITEYSFSSAGSAQNTFSLSSIDGANITSSIDANGVITISSFGDVDSETVRLSIGDRGTGQEIAEKTLTFVRTKTGTPGVSGSSGVAGTTTAVVYAYQRSATALTSDAGNTTVSLSTGKITTSPLANSWSSAIPSGTDPLYIIAATASGVITESASTDTILAAEWSDPVILSQDGVSGSAGEAGLSSAPVFIYQRSASADNAPTGPTGDTTYTFASGSVDFTTANGWSSTIDGAGSGPYLWSRQATAAATTATDTITDSEWSTVTILAQDGDDGVSGSAGEPGAVGLQTAKGLVYYQSASTAAPAKPADTTYTFSTGLFSSLDAGWGTTPPNIVGQEGQFWVSEYNVVESIPEGGTGTATFGTSKSSFNFTDVVIFQDLSADTATVIHGGNISTGEITISDTSLGAIKSGKTAYSDEINSGFFLGWDSNCAKFHIGNEIQNLKWTGSSLQVAGEISSSVVRVKDTIILTDATVQGELEATTLAPGSVTVDSLSNAVINLIDSRVGSQVGSTFDGYYVRNAVSTTYNGAASQSTLLLVNGEGSATAVTRGSQSVELLLKASHFWTSSTVYTTGLTGSAQFQYSTNSNGSPWLNAGSAIPFTITRGELSFFTGNLQLYSLIINNTEEVDVGSEDTAYFWQIKFTTTGGASPLSLSPLTFEASVLEGGAGVTTTGGSASNAATAVQAGSASTLTVSRILTIGDTGKQFNGGANVAWSTSEIGITKANIDPLGISAANATLLNSLSSGAFLRSDADDSAAGSITFANSKGLKFLSTTGSSDAASFLYRAGGNATRFSYFDNSFIFDSKDNTAFEVRNSGDVYNFKITPSASSDSAAIDFTGSAIRYPNAQQQTSETNVVTFNTSTGLLGYRDATAITSTNAVFANSAGFAAEATNAQSANNATTLAGVAATNYLQKGGGTMTGNITFSDDQEGIVWTRNTDGAAIKFYNTGDGDTDSRLEYSTRDNGNEYHRWVHFTPSSTEHELMTLRYSNSAGNLVVTRDITANRNISGVNITADEILSGSTLSITANGTIGGNLTITGDLDVNGTTTTIDSSVVSISALTITVARNATNNATANGGGLFVEGPDASLLYNSTDDGFRMNHALRVDANTDNVGQFNQSDITKNADLLLGVSNDSIRFRATRIENNNIDFHLGRSYSNSNSSTYLTIIGANGNVGIGDTAPDYDLDVVGTINATTLYRLGNRQAINYSSPNMIFGSANGGDSLQLRTGSSGVAMTILSSNNRVGIRTTSPSVTLSVSGDIATTHNAATISTRKIGARDTNGLSIATSNGTSRVDLLNSGELRINRNSDLRIQTESSNTAGLLIFDNIDGTYDWWNYQDDQNDLVWTVTATGGAEMELKANGSSASSAELVIGGGSTIGGTLNVRDVTAAGVVINGTGTIGSSTYANGWLRIGTSSGITMDNNEMFFSGVNDAYFGTMDGSNLNIRTNQVNRLFISGSGTNVGFIGIGTTNPREELEVHGSTWLYGTGSGSAEEAVLKLGTLSNNPDSALYYVYTDDDSNDQLEINTNRYGQSFLVSRGSAAGNRVRSWETVANSNGDERGIDLLLYSQPNSQASASGGSTTTNANVRLSALSNRASYINTAANFMLGTATEIDSLAKLQIVGQSGGFARITMQDADGTNQNTFFTQSGGTTGLTTQNGTSNGIITLNGWDGSTTTEFVRIDSTGSVGIGTATPAGNLHIKSKGDVGDATLILEADQDNDLESDNPRFELRQDGNNIAGYMYLEGNAGTTATSTLANSLVIEQKGDGASNGRIHFATGGKAPTQVGGPTNGTVRMTVSESGRIGVNNTAPAAYMDVRSPDGNLNSLRLGRADNASYWDFNHAGDDLRIYNSDGNGSDILFGVNSGGTALENKVGIGWATPDKALVVSASGATAEIVINDTIGTPVLRFRNNGNTNGLIQTDTVGALILSNSSKTIRFTDTSFRPDLDDTRVIDLGSESARFNRVFLDNAINFGPHGTNPNQVLMQYSRSSGVVGTVTLMERHDELGATSFGGDNTTIIGAGEGRAVAALRLPNLSGEQLHLAAESGIFFHTSPDNWDNGTNSVSAWNTRNEMSFNNSGVLTVPTISVTDLAVDSICAQTVTATTALEADLVRGRTYPSQSYIDFDDDAMPEGSNGTSMRSVASMAFIIDSNNNGTGDAFTWLKDNTVASTATQLMDLDNDGNLTLIGQLNATTKSFLINHPTKEGMKLRYGSLEGPENGVYVRGRATTNVIELPDYWTGLVDETTITVQLTANGRFQKLFVDRIENNKVYLKNASWFSNKVDCYYNVYGERKDVEKLKVEY